MAKLRDNLDLRPPVLVGAGAACGGDGSADRRGAARQQRGKNAHPWAFVNACG
eukprot:gene23428-62892_t